MILNEKEHAMAQDLARNLVQAEREKQYERQRLERIRREQAMQESMESFGRAIKSVHDAYVEGFYKPLNNALKSIGRGIHN